ncbi:type I DNA topoisomerase [Ferruginibacter sp. HRS2-29]|uniref:type I DNA topoisomerase n=1 Tax=Ferruginibacter sp. HRS2-29 TaxID=2487334 RepID=UPI0020CED8EF|nr:type I DNA topoisomerase [Ferruginibacter sp. HRS2-29]MCP9750099.1 type I DNA topoisomerase [Ferruginibacter sp. HRS2-29]
MAKNLLIVESPAKAKTIEGILGKDFEVKSCYGHIRDLEKNDMGIDIANNFTPKYIISPDKTKVVSELKSLAKKSQEVWLASDEDREGESISWHLAEVLNLDPKTTKRIVFHEITKPAIEKAVQNPRTINMDLVNAQQARRVLDRIVGFELSPVLWRKIGQKGGLSAGRVQSVAVKLIAEKEREINQFKPVSSFKIEASLAATDLNNRTVAFKAEGGKYNQAEDAEKFLESCVGAKYTVRDVQVRPGKRTPAAPFTTSTLQQEASRKLGYGVSKTMLLAQKLYESGKITYMRTDSVNLGDTAMDAIKKEISSSYGAQYLQVRKYKNKNESAQEAHEAIRPTYMENHSVNDPELNRLYELIWKRTIASQMSDAEFEKTTAKINISTNNEDLTATGEVLKFDGFLKVYLESTDEDDTEEGDESRLPNLTVGQSLDFNHMTATEKFTKHSARYTEASLVKKLEELGIGRPSTYAPTISTIIKRTYVEKKDKEGVRREYRVMRLKDDAIKKITETENTGAEKSKLFPTDLGLVVTDFLNQHFTNVMDYSFTANIEKEFDEIADGKMVWNKMVGDFYKPFHNGVEHTLETAERAVGERMLGVAEDGKPITARMGRYGPMVQIGAQNDEEKPKFAKLKSTQSIETITLEEALDLFKLPLMLGEYEGQEVSVNIGRFGPYVKWGEQFISLPKGEEPTDVDLPRAIQVISAKQIEDAPIGFYQDKPITKGKGRFGPFIKWNDLFINIPRAYNFDALTQKDCDELIEKKIEKESNRFIQQWPEEKIAIENGRWGPFIRWGKKMLKLGLNAENKKMTAEEAATLDIEEVKKMIVAQEPKAFDKKKAPAKKSAAKKAAPKKAAAKKAAPKKK